MADRIDAFTVHHEIVVKADDFKSEIESIKKNAKEYAETMGGIQSDQFEEQIQNLEQAVDKLTTDMKDLSESVDKIKLSQDVIDGYEKIAQIIKGLSEDPYFKEMGVSVKSLTKLFGELTQLVVKFRDEGQAPATGKTAVSQVAEQAKEATKEVSKLQKAQNTLLKLNRIKERTKTRTFTDKSSETIKNFYNKQFKKANALSSSDRNNILTTSDLTKFDEVYLLFHDVDSLWKEYNSRSSNDDFLRNNIPQFSEFLDQLDKRLDEHIANQEQKVAQLQELAQQEISFQDTLSEVQQESQAVVKAEEAKQDAIKDTNAAMAEQQELVSTPLPSSDSSDNSIVSAQEKIQAEIEETNKGIKNQQEWLKILDQSLDDSRFSTNGKREATEQLRTYTKRLVDYRLHPDNYAGEQYAEEKMIIDWWKANQEAIRQGVADSTLTRYSTDISQKDYEDSLAKLEKERAFRIATLEEYSNKKIQLEQEQQAAQAQASAQNVSNIEQETKAVQENTAAIQQNVEAQQQRTATPETSESDNHTDPSTSPQIQDEINGMTQLREAVEAVKRAIGDKTEQFALERDVAASAIFDEVAYLKDLQEAVEKVRAAVAQVDMEKIKTPTTESDSPSAPNNADISNESKEIESLWDCIVAVIDAIDAKTKAFQDEGIIVDQVVTAENNRLLTLKSTLTDIQTLLGNIIPTLKSADLNVAASPDVQSDLASKKPAPKAAGGSKNIDKVVQAYEHLTKTELQYQTLINKRKGDDKNLTSRELNTLVSLERSRSKANQIISQATDLTNEQSQAQEKYTRKVDETTAAIARMNSAQSGRISSRWGNIVFDAKDIEDAEKQMKARLSSMNMKQVSSLVQSSNGSQFTTKIQTADKQLQKVVYHLEQADNGGYQVYESITKAGEATSSWDKLVSTIGKKFKDLGAYLISFASVYQIWDQVKTGYSYVAELDKQLTEMRKVSDESIESLKKYQKETFAVADAVGTTAAQIQASTADYMRLGESLESAAELAKDTNILMDVSEFTDINEATDSMIAMKQAYQELTSKEIIDSLNYVGNNFSITTAGLAQALQKSAAALKVSGNDFNESIALITAGNSILQDPDSVANGIRTIAMRLNGTTVDELTELGEDTEGLIETSSKLQETVAALTAVNGKTGISLVDSVGNYNSTFENLLAIADRWEEIGKQDALDGKNRQNALMEALAGEFCLKFVETHFYRTHLIALVA